MVINGQLHVREFLERVYLPAHLGIKPASAEQLTVSVRALDTTVGHSVTLDELCDELVVSFLCEYRKSGKAEATVNNKRADILSIWRYAWQKSYIQTCPRDIPKLKEPKKCPRAWSLQQFQSIVSSARLLRGTVGPWPLNDWMEALLVTCYSTAPRISAVMAMKVSDVSLDTGIGYLYEPKDNSEDCYRLIPQCVAALKRIWDSKRTYVFEDWPHDRTQRSWKALNALLKKCIELAGVPDIGRFHAIRKTSATLVYDRDPRAAQLFLGHSDIHITEHHYVDRTKLHHSFPGDLLPSLAI